MTDETMPEELVQELSEGTLEPAQVGAKTGLSAVEMAAALRSKAGRRAIGARRTVMRHHAQLLAGRFVPYALARLIKLLENEKGDVSMRACRELLEIAGLAAAEPKKPRDSHAKQPPAPRWELPESRRAVVIRCLRVLARDPAEKQNDKQEGTP